MINRVCTYAIVILMAALVFYGGAGINIFTFCCDQCRSEGVEAIIDDRCCDVHHCCDEQHADCCHTGTTDPIADHPHCGLTRLSFDWDSQTVQTITPDLLAVDLFYSPMAVVSIVSASADRWADTSIETVSPPPRSYLSLLTVLLI